MCFVKVQKAQSGWQKLFAHSSKQRQESTQEVSMQQSNSNINSMKQKCERTSSYLTNRLHAHMVQQA